MKNKINTFFLMGAIATMLYSCSSANMGISRPSVYYEFGRNDMDVSAQKTATASQTKILGIDWARLFNKQSGNFNMNGYAGESIPFIGSMISPTKVQNYALYNLLASEPGYDFVLYPRFEQKSSGIPILFMKTETKVTAKLGKIK